MDHPQTRRQMIAGALAAGAVLTLGAARGETPDRTPKSPLFDVSLHGALGDGRNDDSAAVQAAIDAAVKAGGGHVRFPPGTYRITRPLVIRSSSHIDITGSGKSTVLLHEHDDHLLVWPEEFECLETSVRDLSIMATKDQSPTTAAIACLGGVARSFFAHLLIKPAKDVRMGSGIVTRKVADTTTLDQCVIWGVSGTGIEVARGSEVRIFGGRVVGHNSPVPYGRSCGVHLVGNNGGVHLVTTDLIGLHTGLRIGEPTGLSNREVFLTHSTLDSCTHGLVQSDHAYTSVAGCWAASCDEEQILLEKEAVHALLVITGGTIFNAGTYGRAGTHHGLVVRAGSFVLSGVAVRHNQGVGILVDSDTVQGYSVTGCRIHDNATGAILKGSAFSFQSNVLLRNGRHLIDTGGAGKLVAGNVISEVEMPEDPYEDQRPKRPTA